MFTRIQIKVSENDRNACQKHVVGVKKYFLSLDLYSMRQHLSFELSCTFLDAFLWKLAIWPIFLVTRARNTCFTSEFALRTACIRKGIIFTPHSNKKNNAGVFGSTFREHRKLTFSFGNTCQKHVVTGKQIFHHPICILCVNTFHFSHLARSWAHFYGNWQFVLYF